VTTKRAGSYQRVWILMADREPMVGGVVRAWFGRMGRCTSRGGVACLATYSWRTRLAKGWAYGPAGTMTNFTDTLTERLIRAWLIGNGSSGNDLLRGRAGWEGWEKAFPQP